MSMERLKATQLERKHRAVVNKQTNLDNWYKKNPWADIHIYEFPEIGDDDYIAESAHFDALFDVPNR